MPGDRRVSLRAMIRKPLLRIMSMMAPECPLEKASGLIMVKVRLLIFSFLLGGKCRDNVWDLGFNSAPLPPFGPPVAVRPTGQTLALARLRNGPRPAEGRFVL